MAYQNVTMPPMDSLPAPPAAGNRRALPAGAVVDHVAMADGWPVRRMRLPAAAARARGALLFIGGRADFFEKYLEPLAHWSARGWHVTAFDWRGQGGSGRLLPDRKVGHIDDFATWVGDLEAIGRLWHGETDMAGPHVAVAHSMGGHLLLRTLVEGRIRADAAVLLSPMCGLNGGPIPAWAGEALATLLCAIGLARRAAWPDRPNSPGRMTRLTHDPGRFADELWWGATQPALTLGPPSWRWLQQAYRSTRRVAAAPALARMDVPALILGTRADALVLPAAMMRIAGRLPHARLHLYGEEAAHELLRETDRVRQDALARVDAFLDEHAPA
jgi:lysophospholipase